MDLVLSDEQELLQRTAREFVAGRSSLKRIRALRDTNDPDGFSRGLWKEMAQLGWTGIAIPEAYGGLGLGHLDLMIVMEAAGRGLLPEPLLSTVALGGSTLLLGGTEEQKREHLSAVAAGERLLAVAYQEEGSRYRLSHVEATAHREQGGWVLRGKKIQVLDAHVADWLVVAARTAGAPTDERGITLFLLRGDTPGVRVERQARIDSRNAGLVHLAEVRVPAEAVLGEVDAGGALLARVVDRATVALTAEMLGSMHAAFDMTLEYLRTRVQFGVPIGSFQALKHRAAYLFAEIELTQSAVMHAHRVLDEGRDDAQIARAASLAKARVSETFMRVAHEAVQMHGGIGMTDEHDIGFYLKRARVAQMTFGDAAFHRDRYAALGGY
jgi:acyl-CoA dehydrogenase